MPTWPGQPASATYVNEVPHLTQKPRSTPGELWQIASWPSVTSKFSFLAPTQVANAAPIAL
jgi:hypothetical protein